MADDPGNDDREAETGDADHRIAQALDAWSALAPPAGFVDRVLDRIAPPSGGADGRGHADSPSAIQRSRWRRLAGIATIAVAASAAAVALWPANRAAHGALLASQRVTARLGDRGLAVAEPASALTWRVDDHGAADVVQRAGNVFYRVERGGAFVVHTPAGDLRVTGTCFRVEVEAMNTNQKMLLAGLAGAALATTVLVTVYEGHVVAETRAAKTELSAGARATLGGPDRATVVGDAIVASATPDEAHATREQLVVLARQQAAQLAQLRARLARLEQPGASGAEPDRGKAEPGRAWYDPSPEQLAAWVAECRIRADQPSLQDFTPLTEATDGLEPGELDGYNAAMLEMAKQWKDLVRRLYVETTGDTGGVESLSIDSMSREIQDKSAPGEHNAVLQRLAQERAGLVPPPADLARTSTLERLQRAYLQLGDQSEAAVAKRLGPARAHALRGEGWGSRSEQSGCPSPGH